MATWKKDVQVVSLPIAMDGFPTEPAAIGKMRKDLASVGYHQTAGHEYVLRGSPGQMAKVVEGLAAQIRTTLLTRAGPGYDSLVSNVQITPLGWQLPF